MTEYRLITPGDRDNTYRGSFSFAPRRPVRIRTEHNHPDIALRVRIEFVVTEEESPPDRYLAVISAYNYQIMDLHERELLAFHWHPVGESSVRHPHLHLSSQIHPIDVYDPANPNRTTGQVALAEMHIATGTVLFEDVIRLLIEEFKAIPLRSDWDDILREVASG